MFDRFRRLFSKEHPGDLIGRNLSTCLRSASGKDTYENNGSDRPHLRDFEAISLECSLPISVVAGSDYSVRIAGRIDICEHIQTRVKNNTLVIEIPSTVEIPDRVRATITAPSITRIAVLGSGRAAVEGIVADRFDADVCGSGVLKLKGSVCLAVLSVSGSGMLSATELIAKQLQAEVLGSGDMYAFASEEVSGQVLGSGSLSVKGKPKTVKKLTTLGSGHTSIR